ncbi:MAG: hypothetical protein OEZ51_13920 [Nitrospinota bacterium]|nr:hypothetical protein [Nitrospinota bacterium]
MDNKPTSPQRKTLKNVILRRGEQVIVSVSTRKLVPGIEQGKLFPTDEISSDGIDWVELGEHKQLHAWFEKFSQLPTIDETAADEELDKEFFKDASGEEHLPPPLIQRTLDEMSKLIDEINE